MRSCVGAFCLGLNRPLFISIGSKETKLVMSGFPPFCKRFEIISICGLPPPKRGIKELSIDMSKPFSCFFSSCFGCVRCGCSCLGCSFIGSCRGEGGACAGGGGGGGTEDTGSGATAKPISCGLVQLLIELILIYMSSLVTMSANLACCSAFRSGFILVIVDLTLSVFPLFF